MIILVWVLRHSIEKRSKQLNIEIKRGKTRAPRKSVYICRIYDLDVTIVVNVVEGALSYLHIYTFHASTRMIILILVKCTQSIFHLCDLVIIRHLHVHALTARLIDCRRRLFYIR